MRVSRFSMALAAGALVASLPAHVDEHSQDFQLFCSRILERYNSD
jgi:hypothetical protein